MNTGLEKSSARPPRHIAAKTGSGRSNERRMVTTDSSEHFRSREVEGIECQISSLLLSKIDEASPVLTGDDH